MKFCVIVRWLEQLIQIECELCKIGGVGISYRNRLRQLLLVLLAKSGYNLSHYLSSLLSDVALSVK